MVTIKSIIRSGKQNKQGLYNIYIEVNNNGRREYFSLDKFVKEEDWDKEKGLVKRSYPNSKRLNNYIQKQLRLTELNIEKLEKKALPVQAKKLKRAIKSADQTISFITFAEENLTKAEKVLKIGTFRCHQTILTKLKEYLNGKPLLLEDVNVKFLTEYEAYLRDTLKNNANTVHNNLKTIRKWVLDAVRQDLLPYEKNPFLRFRLKRCPTNKVFLTEDELKAIESLVLTSDSILNHHRNMYVCSCYIGLRISDMLLLKWKDIQKDILYIKIHKTEEILTIKLPNKVIEILDFYRPAVPNHEAFVFPILKTGKDYSDPNVLFYALSSASAYVNKDLRKVASKARINKHLSFHTSRVTFATRALRKGINLKIVSRLMGHRSVSTTEIYTKIVDKDLMEAMNVFN